MKHFKLITVLLFIIVFAANAFAGDKEDVQALIDKSAEYFNKKDYKAYWSLFTADNTEFPYVASTLRHDAKTWKTFVEGTSALAYVNYHGHYYSMPYVHSHI